MALKNKFILLQFITLAFFGGCNNHVFDPFVPSENDLIVHLPFDGHMRDVQSGALPIAIQSGVLSSGNISAPSAFRLVSDRFGRAESALRFSGKWHLEYPYYPNQSVFDSIYYPQLSVSAWVKLDSIEPNLYNSVMISTVSSANNNIIGILSLSIDTRQPPGKPATAPYSVSFRSERSGGSVYAFSRNLDSTLFFNKFHHICVTKHDDNLTVYLNGEKIEANVFLNRLGNRGQVAPFSFQVGRFFIGVLDDVRIYSRALSDREVKLLYNI